MKETQGRLAPGAGHGDHAGLWDSGALSPAIPIPRTDSLRGRCGWEWLRSYALHNLDPQFLFIARKPIPMSAILIVDDNAYFRDYLCEAVRRLGYAPIMAASAREGLSVLASQPVRAVISDLLMPQMDGLELARAIRSQHPRMPLLILSDGPEAITAPCLRAAQLIYGAAVSEKSSGDLGTMLADFLAQPGKEAREPAA